MMNEFNYFLMNVVISIVWIAIIVLAVGVACLFLSLIVNTAIQKFKSPKQEAEEWGKDNPPITVVEDKGDPRKEWGYMQLSAADEMVMATMGDTAKFDYVTNKINIFRGSATPIKVYVEHGPIVGPELRIKWEEI